MTRSFANVWIYRLILVVFAESLLMNGFAQPECRSILGAYFKPVSPSLPVSWASEIIVAPGVMSDRTIFNGMAYAGLDFNSKSFKHQLYFEGAFKYSYSSSGGPGLSGAGTGYSDFSKIEKKHFGFRELFYSYRGWMDLKAGIQAMKTGGSMLLDERVLGISAAKETGQFIFKLNGATVYDDIARMQDVCGTRHLYNLVRGSKVNFVGDKWFESNFFLAEVLWQPGKKKVSGERGSDDFGDFESGDEFGAFDPTASGSTAKSELQKSQFLRLKDAGFRFYEEFGEVFFARKYYGGTVLNFDIGGFMELNSEVLGQITQTNDAVIYRLALQKEKFRDNGALTAFRAQYFGLYSISDTVKHFPSFSNLFKGEVMRLDMMHIPLIEFSISHRWAGKLKPGAECKYIHQIRDAKTREFDLLFTLHPLKHLRLNAIGSLMNSKLMEEKNFLLRLEAHYAF